MEVTSTYTGASVIVTTASTTATVTLGSLIGMDALTIMVGLFGGFVALAFPITGKLDPDQKYTVSVVQVLAAGMVAASLTEVALSYTLIYLTVTHEGAAKAASFTLGYLAKWLLPVIAEIALDFRKGLFDFVIGFLKKK